MNSWSNCWSWGFDLGHPWWRHQMKTFSVLLAVCEGNPPVTGGFPSHKRPVTWSFAIFFDVGMGNRLSKQSKCGWFETPWPSLWRHSIERNNRYSIITCKATEMPAGDYVNFSVPAVEIVFTHIDWKQGSCLLTGLTWIRAWVMNHVPAILRIGKEAHGPT